MHKVSLFLLPSSVCPNLYFFAPLIFWNFSPGTSLSISDYLDIFFQRFPGCCQEGPVLGPRQGQSVYAYHLMHMWARLILSHLVVGAG